MKITALEVIFWFPLKSFSSLKCILLSVLTAFVSRFKDNHKGYVTSVDFFFLFLGEAISCNAKKGYILSTSGLRGKWACLATSTDETFRIIMGLAGFSFLLFLFFFLRGLNLCFPWDVVFQILFLFCTCCFRLVKCSWIMLVYFHNFVLWEESCRETFSQNGADMFGRWGQTDGVRRIFVFVGKNNQGCAFPDIHSQSGSSGKRCNLHVPFIKFFQCRINSSKEGYEFLLS